MDECILPNEIVVYIAKKDIYALIPLSGCCKALKMEFYLDKILKITSKKYATSKSGNLMYLFTHKLDDSNVYMKLVFVDKTQTIYTLLFNVVITIRRFYDTSNGRVMVTTPTRHNQLLKLKYESVVKPGSDYKEMRDKVANRIKITKVEK